MPFCSRLAEHAHHIVRRSQLAGDYAWIEVEGLVLPNLAGLCVAHHDEITGSVGGHKAAVRLIEGKWWWCRLSPSASPLPVSALDPQPPTPEELAPQAAGHTQESDTCPFCGQARRRRPLPRAGGRRRRKSWTIQVPDDLAEDGAELLDVLIDDLALVIGVEPNATGRYYVVLPTLYLAVQNKQAFVENLQGAGG